MGWCCWIEAVSPKDWVADEWRRQEAYMPDKLGFRTKPELAQQMLERVLQSEMSCAWVTGDTVYRGDGHLRLWLEHRQQAYVLAIAKNNTFTSEPRWGKAEA